MPYCFIATLIFLTFRVTATAGEFGFGDGVPMTNGLTQVFFNLDKGFSTRLARCRIGVLEVRLTYTNNILRRTSMLYVGSHALRTPLSVEALALSAGAMAILLFVAIAGLFTWNGFSKKHAETHAPPSSPEEKMTTVP